MKWRLKFVSGATIRKGIRFFNPKSSGWDWNPPTYSKKIGFSNKDEQWRPVNHWLIAGWRFRAQVAIRKSLNLTWMRGKNFEAWKKHPKPPFWQGKCMNTMMRKSFETVQQNPLKSGCYFGFWTAWYDSSDEDMAEQQGNGGNEVLRTRTRHLWNTSESPHYYHLPI